MQNSLQRSAYEKNRLIDTKVSQEGERGDGPGTGPWRFPWRRPLWGRMLPLNPWRSKVEWISTYSPWRTPLWSKLHEGGCDCVRSHTGAGSWQNVWFCGERSLCWGSFSGRICDPMGSPCWSRAFLRVEPCCKALMLDHHKELQCLVRTNIWKACEGKACPFSWEGPCTSSGKECEGSHLWGGWSIRENMWWIDYSHHSPQPCTLWRERIWRWSFFRKKKRQEDVLRFEFISYYSTEVVSLS